MSKLTVLSPVVKIRRGPNTVGAVLREAKNGQQYDVQQFIPAPRPPEEWAKITLPDAPGIDAYICVTMATGTRLCAVEEAETQGTYADGFRAGVEHVLRMIATERAKLGA
jgi:hypothetical protein